MREIKFRAWDKIAKMFVQVSWAFDIDNSGSIYPCKTTPETDLVLLQYTGLHDKNGVEIYEGDIVKFWDKEQSPIFFKGGCFCVKLEVEWAVFGIKTELHYLIEIVEQCEVIGNIYESPELLK